MPKPKIYGVMLTNINIAPDMMEDLEVYCKKNSMTKAETVRTALRAMFRREL